MANQSEKVPVKTEAESQAKAPARAGQSLREQINHLFDAFESPWSFHPFAGRIFDTDPGWKLRLPVGPAMPATDLVEREKEFQISAELPGMEEKDIEIGITRDMLTIKGEKREEKEEKKKDYYMSERSYGSFQRSFRLPDGVDRDKIDAKYEKGVLTITLPKTTEAQKQERKIPIKAK